MSNESKDAVLLQGVNLREVFHAGSSEVLALQDVSIDIFKGEMLSIMGASGAGKSTLLHILGGLEAPNSGRVFLRGEDLYAKSGAERSRIRARDFGFVFQSYHLLPELDVLENVLLPSRTGATEPCPQSELKERAKECLDRVGLSARVTHRPTELSGGEQQRVALARSLMNRPGILLADEPTGNLDSKTGGQVLDYLFSLVQEQGQTLVMVTHNEAVAGLCKRQLVLHDGRLAG